VFHDLPCELFGDSGLDLVRLDPVLRHVFADGTMLDSTSDPAAMAARIRTAFGDQAGKDWDRLWRRAGRVWSASWRHVLQSMVDSPLDLVRLAWRLRDLAAVRPGATLRGVGRSTAALQHLRVLLDRYATYAGSDPRRAPAALIAIPYAELTFGGWYLRGGLASLADELRAQCEVLGVRIRTGTPVAAIEATGGRVRGVRLADSTRVAADVVVTTPTPRRCTGTCCPRRAGPDVAPTGCWRTEVSAASSCCSGVHGTTPGLAQHTVYFPPDYDAEFDAIFGRPARPRRRVTWPGRPGGVQRSAVQARPAIDPTVYVSVADDPAVRPDGYEAWFVLVNAPPHGPFDWRAPGVADAYADHVLATLAARGVDVRDRILFREVRTPADLEADTWTPGGAIYGTPQPRPVGLPPPPQPRTGTRPVPGRRLDPPRRRTTHGRTVGCQRGRRHHPQTTRPDPPPAPRSGRPGRPPVDLDRIMLP